MLYLFQLRK